VEPHLQTSVDRIIGETDFSGVVRVARGGDVLYERTSGLADRAHRILNTATTRFGIASGTKGFTALTIMSLVAEGSLTLDTPVRGALGDAHELIDPRVTVGHLLAHTSGIGDYLDEETMDDIDEYEMPGSARQFASTGDYLAVLKDIRRSSKRVRDSNTATAATSSWHSSRKPWARRASTTSPPSGSSRRRG